MASLSNSLSLLPLVGPLPVCSPTFVPTTETKTLTLVLLAGRLSYDTNLQKKEISVWVTGMREEYDYHLRLCRKDFICTGTGAKTLVSDFLCL